MNAKNCPWGRTVGVGGLCTLVIAGIALFSATSSELNASPLSWWRGHRACKSCVSSEEPFVDEIGGTWYWMRSPEQEKRVVMGLFNRYCIRCHGVDGRGIWDIPDVPNFTNAHWQASRTDGQLARAILEGRGSVMPPWRGTLSLEEAWALARYVRTFVPGTEVSRPDFSAPETPGSAPQKPAQSKNPVAP
jgi:hypothetical protein